MHQDFEQVKLAMRKKDVAKIMSGPFGASGLDLRGLGARSSRLAA